MKIGIMSMHRIKNLGSFMQAYGLKKTIESLGHKVVFIDCKNGEKIENIKITDRTNKKSIYENLYKAVHFKKVLNFRNTNKNFYNNYFEKYINENLNIQKENNREKCDVLVVGSDEVFNCLNNAFGFSDDIFGGYPYAKKIISYAASCGWTKFDFLNEAQKQILKKSIPNFYSMSVRDENTYKFISNFYDKEITESLDPVLISDFNDFNVKTQNKIKGNYIIVYAYNNRISDKDEINRIKKFAKNKKCKIVAVGSPQFWCDKFIPLYPNEIFDFFSNAKYIITDTFHGTIFSIRTHSKFITIIRKSNKNKLEDLLNRLELSDRMYTLDKDIFKIMDRDIDYKKIDNKLLLERKKSIKYLKRSINGE